MEAFTFDTSGAVKEIRASGAVIMARGWVWSDLDRFTQGYIAALIAELDHARWNRYRAAEWGSRERAVPIPAAYSWLAHEALDRIIADCAWMTDMIADPASAEAGRRFWQDRQVGGYEHFATLTPYLGDDGRVYLRERA